MLCLSSWNCGTLVGIKPGVWCFVLHVRKLLKLEFNKSPPYLIELCSWTLCEIMFVHNAQFKDDNLLLSQLFVGEPKLNESRRSLKFSSPSLEAWGLGCHHLQGLVWPL